MEYGLSLGSNLDDKAHHLRDARRALTQHSDIKLLEASALYETEPVDVQPEYADFAFFNAVLIIESALSPDALLKVINEVESQLGRIRQADRNAPRTIDIDILYAGNKLIDSGNLTVPHPRWAERAFVVIPLAETRPQLILPGSNLSVTEQKNSLSNQGGVIRLPDAWE